MKIPKALLDKAHRELKARNDAINACALRAVERGFVTDAQLAPLWAEKLRHTYTTVERVIYPDLDAVNGRVLPIDSSVDPTTLEWEYFQLDSGGFCDWIDDDGDVRPSAFLKAKRFTGKQDNIGGGYHYTIFDLERYAKAGMGSPLPTEYALADRRAHDEKIEWTWMVGEPSKQIHGLLTHPNIPCSFARAGVSTSAIWDQKTDDEILRDFTDLIDVIPQQSVEAHHCVKVLMPHKFIRHMRKRFVAATATGTVSLWDKLKALYSGDDSGQGKVEFVGLNILDASRRKNPKTKTDTSGITGDIMVALPAADVNSLCFIRSRPYTQMSPQEDKMRISVLTYGTIGGVKCTRPLSANIMFFGGTLAS